MKKLKILLDKKKISLFDYNQIKASYIGHLSHGDTKKLTNIVLIKGNKTTKVNIIGKLVKIVENKIIYVNEDK